MIFKHGLVFNPRSDFSTNVHALTMYVTLRTNAMWRHVLTMWRNHRLRANRAKMFMTQQQKFDIDGGLVFVSGLPSNAAREKDPRNQSRADATTHRWTLARLPPATTDVSLLCSSSCDNELHTTTTDPRKPRSRVDLKFIQIIRLSSELH